MKGEGRKEMKSAMAPGLGGQAVPYPYRYRMVPILLTIGEITDCTICTKAARGGAWPLDRHNRPSLRGGGLD